MKINRTTLPNGLRLVHCEDKTTQMVCVNTLYQVGSRNESPDHTGFAHLFEHLMFGGTPEVPDFDETLQEACGENNAYTTEDVTNYYITLPAQNIETALWLESDRMSGLAFTPQSLEVQRKVVMEEFKLSYLNQPYGDLSHLLFRLAFPKDHPYSWPTIGLKLSHIRNATMSEVKQFFADHYRPDNAIIAIVGNIGWKRTKMLVEKWFGGIGPSPLPLHKGGEYIPTLPKSQPLDGVTTPPPCGEVGRGSGWVRHRTYRRSVPSNLLLMAFRIPSRLDDRFQACDMLSDLLANGKSSLLYSHLVEQQRLCESVEAYVSGRLGTGLLIIEAMMAEGADIHLAEQTVWKDLDHLRNDLLAEEELDKVKNKYETNTYILLSDYMQRAEQLAYFEMLGDARWLENDLPRYLAVTADEVRKVARQVLPRRNASVLHYLAKE